MNIYKETQDHSIGILVLLSVSLLLRICLGRTLQNVLKAKCSHYTYKQTHIVREKYFITHNPGQLPCFSKQFHYFFFLTEMRLAVKI